MQVSQQFHSVFCYVKLGKFLLLCWYGMCYAFRTRPYVTDFKLAGITAVHLTCILEVLVSNLGRNIGNLSWFLLGPSVEMPE